MSRYSYYCKPTFLNISEEKRKKILSVAVNEFANNGFENANINIIAKKAEVSVGSLYKYFDTKNDLFLTSVNFGLQNLEAVLNAIIGTDDPIMLKLENLLRSDIEFSRSNSVFIKLYNVLTGECNNELAQKIAADVESITASVYRKAIGDGQLSGEIRKDIDPGIAAYLVDNILMNVQFTYACDYYKERFKIYTEDEIFQKDSFVIENILKFIKAALKL